MAGSNNSRRAGGKAAAVRVVACHAAHGHGLQNTHEPVAVVSFARGREVLDPIALQLPQVMILIEDLRKVLHVFRKDIPLVGIGGPSEETLQTTSPPRALNVHRPVRPSKRPDMPQLRVGRRDVEILKGLLSKVQSHEEFLRFISDDRSIVNDPKSSKTFPRALTPKKMSTRTLKSKSRKK